MAYQVSAPLIEKYVALKEKDRQDVAARIAQLVPGGSVIRVFNKGTSKDLVAALKRIDLDALANCQTQEEFDRFFFQSLDQIDAAILILNKHKRSLGRGHKWGHASKILCLYLRDIVLFSRYFDDTVARRLQGFLYMPIDSVVMKHLRACGSAIKPQRIKDIDSEEEFREIQNLLALAARRANAPRIIFDNVWSEDR